MEELNTPKKRRIDWPAVSLIVVSFLSVMVFAWIASGAKMPWEA